MNNRVIILEGPDCSGKTTLAVRLMKEFGFKMIHTSQPKTENTFKEYTDVLMEALEFDRPVVFDRLHAGECIYGPMKRGIDTLTPLGFKLINRVIAARDVKLIWCLPDFDEFKKTIRQRKDSFVTAHEAERIYKQYKKMAKNTAPFTHIYNYLENDSHYFTSFDSDMFMFYPRPTLPSGSTGYPTAKYLIVGEAVNGNVLHHELPFHSLTNSSAVINEAISCLGNKNFAFANAETRHRNVYNLQNVVSRLPHLVKVIALGRTAEEACKRQGIPVAYVPHPSMVKRFQHSTIHKYVDLITEAIL